MSIRQKSHELWTQINPNDDDNAKMFLESLTESLKEHSKTYSQSYYSVLVIAVFYWVLYNGNIQEFKFLDLSIKDIVTLRWATVAIMAFIYYQGVSSLAIERYIMDIYGAFWEKHLPIIAKNKFISFTFPPTFFNNERLLSNNKENKLASGAANIFGIILMLLLFLAPLSLTLLFMYANISTLNPAEITFIKIITGLISLFLIIRTVAIILFDILHYGEE